MKVKARIGIAALIGIVLIIGGFVLFFNRAPQRAVPPDPASIVSPANGTVIHVAQVPTRTVSFFKKDIVNVLDISEIDPPYTIVVIEMTPMDVHVQRAPIAGDIAYQEHVPGRHKNAVSGKEIEKLSNVNEKNIVVFKDDDLSVGVIQVAGRAARRIRSFVAVGDSIKKGDIYGRILLGSQVVVVLPQTVTVDVAAGDRLIDGESVIGTIRNVKQ